MTETHLTDTRPTDTRATDTRATGAPRHATDEPAATRRLRTALRLNGGTTIAFGLLLLLAAGPVDDLLGTDRPGWVRLVGLGLLPYAAFLLRTAAGTTQRLRRETPIAVAGDLAWVAGSGAGLLLDWFDGWGIAAVVAVAAVVETYAVLQFVGWRRLPVSGRPERRR